MDDVCFDGHNRFQGQLIFIHFVGRVAAVKDNARTNCVKMDCRQFHNGSTVCKSFHRHIDACGNQSFIKTIVFFFLLVGIGLVISVSGGHVGEQTFDFEACQHSDFFDIENSVFDFVCQIADSAHAGVNRDKTGNDFSCFQCGVADGFGIGSAADYRCDVVFHDGVCIHVRRQSQHDDFFCCSSLTKHNGFLQCCDSKSFYAVGAQHVCAYHCAVAVSIGFDDADDFFVCADFCSDVFDVVV